ncbi:MAG: DUF4351 domain-containing protein [Chloroflexota bacterium]
MAKRRNAQKTTTATSDEATAIYTESDSVWKDMLDRYFPDFMAFFFPDTYKVINWERGYEFLDTELQKLSVQNLTGKRLADKLVKVHRVGEENAVCIFIHIEVQNYPDPTFVERMYVYNYRIFDRFYEINRKKAKAKKVAPSPTAKVISLAVLTDDNDNYRPCEFHQKEDGGYELLFHFPMIKLLDYNDKWAKLEAETNLFAVVVMAHLKAQQEKKNPLQLLDWKVRLVEMLYQRNYEKEQVQQLLRFIDWIMVLPKDLEPLAQARLAQLEEDVKMAYVTSFERLGIEKGREEGLKEGLEKGREEGIEEGIKEGLVKGLVKGLEEGLVKGQQTGATEIVLRLLKRKFGNGEFTSEIEQQINTLTLAQLEDLSDHLLNFSNRANLEAWLQLQKGPPSDN